MKILKFYLLNRIVKDPIVTSQIYNMIYHRGIPPQKNESKYQSFSQESFPKITEVKTPTNTRKQELLNALNELKNKPLKSKQDKESIGIIEAALKNGYE